MSSLDVIYLVALAAVCWCVWRLERRIDAAEARADRLCASALKLAEQNAKRFEENYRTTKAVLALGEAFGIKAPPAPAFKVGDRVLTKMNRPGSIRRIVEGMGRSTAWVLIDGDDEQDVLEVQTSLLRPGPPDLRGSQ